MPKYKCPECKHQRSIDEDQDPADICIYCRMYGVEQELMDLRRETPRRKHGEA